MPSHRGGFNNSGKTDKPQDLKKIIKDLAVYIKPIGTPIIFAVIFAAMGSFFTIIGPNQLSKITDTITAGLTGTIDLDKITKIGFFLVTIYALSALLTYAQGFIMATTTQTIANKLRSDITAKINKLPLKYFDTHSYGDTLSRMTNDVDTIGQTLNQSLGGLVSNLTLFIGSLIMMFKTNVIMTLTAMASTLIGFLLLMIIMKYSQKFFVAQQNNLGEVNGYVEEVYSGHNVVYSYNAIDETNEKFNTINDKLFNSVWRAQFFSGLMQPLMGFIGNFGYVSICIVGAALAIDNKISFGVIVAFMVYIRLFTQSTSQISQAFSNLQTTGAASERVFTFLNEEELSNEDNITTTLTDVKGDVAFDHVHFGYNPDKIIINDFSAEGKPGQKIAIVGPTGAGKTTIVNLLMRFYELNSGHIEIDGIKTTDITRENVHDLFCMVLQDTWLFEGTIRENIVYSKTGVTDEQVINACKAVGVDHFINTLSDGYDTVLESESTLSAGQRQLITIARALIKDSPMLILDEATSSVDTRTEELIQKAMDKLMEGRTSFVIAHRLSTIRNADLILVMKDGDIIESGTHDGLLSENGFYADLYNSQFEEGEEEIA